MENSLDKAKYLDMCFQMGDEPDMERCPPDLDDLPLDVQKAVIVYGKLGDRIASEIGYIGKDFTALEYLTNLYEVDSRELFMETILLLDQSMIEKSAAAMKRERDKMKKK